nr:type II secretion system F family protein [Anaerolineae bacterium]
MSPLPFIILGLIIVIIAVALVVVGMRSNKDIDPLEERLALYGGTQELAKNLEDIEMSVPFTERVLLPIAQQMSKLTSRFTPQETLENTQRQLELAGRPNNMTPAVFWVIRLSAMAFFAIFLLFILSVTKQKALFIIGGVLGGAVLGFILPPLWLRGKISRRQDEIIKSLPDALDLMSICVNAGLGFDQAMGRVYEKWDNELGMAFGRVIQEIRLGKTRREALRAMDESIGVADVTTFIGAIIQADQLGVSISKILNIQADQMRMKRRQRAEQKAQAAPVKMMIPLAIFIFPSIYIVLLGPAGVMLYSQFFGN